MQGKALGALLTLALFCAALAGCGGGAGESQNTSSTAPASTARESEQPPAAVQKPQQDTERVRAESKQQGEAQTHSDGAGDEDAKSAHRPPAAPEDNHRDSGGGVAQFRTEGGDNSIQESGEEGSEAQLQAAAAVLHAYFDARVAHNWDEACFYLSASAVAMVEEFASRYGKDKGIESCSEVLATLSTGSGQSTLEETARADVGSLRIEGDHGFLLYRGGGGIAYVMPVVTEGGTWKVAGIDGTGL